MTPQIINELSREKEDSYFLCSNVSFRIKMKIWKPDKCPCRPCQMYIQTLIILSLLYQDLIVFDVDPSAWKVSKYGVISGPYSPVFSPNTGKFGPEITPYLETFHAVYRMRLLLLCSVA